MDWIWLALGSAIALGIYDIFKKVSLNGNAVWPVLFLCSATGALFLFPWLILGKVPSLNLWAHLQILGKAGLVTASWACTFSALKHLPLSVGAPLRASTPLFTLFFAITLLGERPQALQWVGIFTTFFGYYFFSLAGKREGLRLTGNPWIGLMLLGTILGSCSGIYDKYLIQKCGLDPLSVQVWFSIYMAIQQAFLSAILWWPYRKDDKPFYWRWSIPMVGLLLILADRFYFCALQQPDALIGVISLIRRSNVLVSFSAAILFLHESQSKTKWVALGILLTGVSLLILGK